MLRKLACMICIIGAIWGCSRDTGTSATGRITISGAWALYPMVVKWAEEYRKENPGIVIDISAGGAGKGMADALSGTVDLGMVSRDVKKAELDRGAWFVSVVKDAVVPTMNVNNPLKGEILKRGIKKDEFVGIWMSGKIASWGSLVKAGNGRPIHVYTRSDACGAAETWAKYVGGEQEDLKGVGVYGDPGLAEAVRKDQLGVGYNNVNFAYDAKTKQPVAGIIPLPIDINGNGSIDPDENVYGDRDAITRAIAHNRYPSPPARKLHLVAKGIPEKTPVLKFLVWILTDGQKHVSEAGYISLPAEEIEREAAGLKKRMK